LDDLDFEECWLSILQDVLKLGFLGVVAMVRLGLWIWGRKTREVK
jgi:hypothetical protein